MIHGFECTKLVMPGEAPPFNRCGHFAHHLTALLEHYQSAHGGVPVAQEASVQPRSPKRGSRAGTLLDWHLDDLRDESKSVLTPKDITALSAEHALSEYTVKLRARARGFTIIDGRTL